MRRARYQLSKDPAGQVAALVTVVVATCGALAEGVRWLAYCWRRYWYARIFKQLCAEKQVKATPEAMAEAAKHVSDACAKRAPTLAKSIAGVTVGDFFALALWRVLKVILLILLLGVLLMGVGIPELRERIGEMERMLR